MMFRIIKIILMVLFCNISYSNICLAPDNQSFLDMFSRYVKISGYSKPKSNIYLADFVYYGIKTDVKFVIEEKFIQVFEIEHNKQKKYVEQGDLKFINNVKLTGMSFFRTKFQFDIYSGGMKTGVMKIHVDDGQNVIHA